MDAYWSYYAINDLCLYATPRRATSCAVPKISVLRYELFPKISKFEPVYFTFIGFPQLALKGRRILAFK